MIKYEIEKSPLWLDIAPILKNKRAAVSFDCRGMIHTELEDLAVLKIVAVDTVRDYTKHIGDYIHIECMIGLGDYVAKIYPHRHNLEYSLKLITLDATTQKDPLTDTAIYRYKAIFLPNDNPPVSSSELQKFSLESLNKSDFVTIKLQLMDRSLEPLRIKTVSGVYRHTSQKTLLQSLLVGESNKVLVDGKPSIDGIDIAEPDNTKLSQHVMIKDGTLLTELPSYLQEHMGGVYTSGIGNYLQTYRGKKLWFVYPIFDPRRFNNLVSRCIFYSVPEERFPELDRTYEVNGSVIKIISNSTKRYQDTAETELMNKGSGFRMANANAFMKKPANVTDEGIEASRVRLNYEVVNKSRTDGLNYAPVSQRISSNPFTEYSKVILRDVGRVDITWQYANPNLLYPGMPCKYCYLEDDKVIELIGQIAHVHSFLQLQGRGLESKIYRSQCVVTLLVTKAPTVQLRQPLGPSYGVF